MAHSGMFRLLSPEQPGDLRPSCLRALGARAAIFFILIATLFGCGCGKVPADSRQPATRPSTTTGIDFTQISEGDILSLPCKAQLDFGVLPKGGSRTLKFWLHNPGKTSIEITTIKTSCDCFTLESDNRTLAAGAKVGAIAKVQFADDPAFAGSLLMDATGQAQGGSPPAITIYAAVTVQ